MVVKVSLIEKVAFQQRLERGEGVGRGQIWEIADQAEEKPWQRPQGRSVPT